MEVSMDGLRKGLCGNVQNLRDIVERVTVDDYFDNDELIEAMNDVIRDSNVLNCVYSDDNKSFNDIGHVEVAIIEQAAGAEG